MQIRTDVELKLRQAGIPVLIEEQSMSRVDAPVLFVVLNAVKNPEVPLYAFSANVELHQVVRLIRNPAATIRAATLVYITIAFSKLCQLSSRKASMRQPLFSVKGCVWAKGADLGMT